MKVPLCHYRVMHRKRVTSELYDSYFRLMTIKHSISKIEWASNDYIIHLSTTSQWGCQWSSRQLESKCGRESHTRPDGFWGPEKMLIRCSKESQHPAKWALGLRLSSPREQERHNVTVITVGSKYFNYFRTPTPTPTATQTLNNPFEPLQIKWEVYILLKKSSCVCLYHCVVMML